MRFEVQSGGKTYEVDAPDQASAMKALQPLMEQGKQALGQQQPANPMQGQGSMLDSAINGLTAGWGDEAAGLLGGAADWLGLGPEGSKGTFSGGYDRVTSNIRNSMKDYQDRHPYLAAGAEIAGSLPTMLIPGGAAMKGASLPAKVAGGIAAGAAYGGLYGAGNASDGLSNRIAGAAEGAAMGGATGGILPVVGRAVKVAGKPVVDAVFARTNAPGYAATKVADRLADAGLSTQEAADRITRAGANGQSMSLMDVGGDGIRRLGRTIVNTNGPGGTRLSTQANLGAMAQGDRVKAAISEVLANPNADYQAAKNGIMDARSSAAKPLYDLAYKQPVPYTRELEDLLKTPAGKAALASAKQNTANRREPWQQWFASIDDDGNILDMRRVPDTRALDEVKRVLDRMVEDAKAPADGSPFAKARATPKSIAIQSVRDDLVDFLRTNNTTYARASDKALSNIQADEAIEFGRNALSMDPRIVARRMGQPSAGRDRVLTDGQKELARIGVAEALRDKIDNAGFTHNALLKFFSTREQIARIRPFFRSEQDWRWFRQAMFNEARKRKSYNALTGNSTTAKQLADMQEAGQLGEMAGAAVQAARGGVVSAALSVLQSSLRRLSGLTPRTADEMAKLIASRDPDTVSDVIAKLQQIETARASRGQKLGAVRDLLTKVIATQAGAGAGRQPTGALGVQTQIGQ